MKSDPLFPQSVGDEFAQYTDDLKRIQKSLRSLDENSVPADLDGEITNLISELSAPGVDDSPAKEVAIMADRTRSAIDRGLSLLAPRPIGSQTR